MQFKDIIGQAALKEKLIHTVKGGRISHAQLFLGPAGYGCLPMAVAYAQYVSCAHRGDHDSCGTCPSCVKYQKLIHPDLHFVFPVNSTKSITADKKPVSDHFIAEWRKELIGTMYFTEQDWYESIGLENKQGNISANEADKIIGKLNLKSYESDYKIMIIWLPERLNTTSANRLLKLIEEPPQNTIFIFVAENEGQILRTIYSRTQRIKFPPIEEQDIMTALRAKGGIEEKDVFTAARLSNGDYIQALQTLQNARQKSVYFDAFVNLMRLSYRNDILGLLNWAEEMAGMGRERQKTFLVYAERLVRENFMLNLKLNEVVYLGFEEYEWAQKFSAFINKDNVFELYKQLNDCIPQIAQNGNAKIIFSDLVLKVKELIRPSK